MVMEIVVWCLKYPQWTESLCTSCSGAGLQLWVLNFIEMNNLFSIFRPNVGWTTIPLNWAATLWLVALTPLHYWCSINQVRQRISHIRKVLKRELRAVLGGLRAPGRNFILQRLIIFILFTNILGLLPYVFTRSSHLVFTVRLALPTWLGFTFLGWTKTPIKVLKHLVPAGTPRALKPFIVVIELIRINIRPLTLRVRLAANLTAGHLLLTLLTRVCPRRRAGVCGAVLVPLVALITLEVGVALIQRYVFTILISLYLQEAQCPELVLTSTTK